jgi:O-antigen ligase
MQSDNKISLVSLFLLLATLTLFASWLAPGHYFPWVSYQNETVAGVAGMLVGFAAALAPRGTHRWPRAGLFVGLVALVPVVQFALGQIAFRSDALLSFLYLGTLSAAIAAGATLAHHDRRRFVDCLLGSLLAAALVSVGLAVVQWLALNPSEYIAWVPPGYRPIGNIAQPNHLASLFILGLLGALWLYETQRIGGRVLLAVGLWLALGLALAQSRMSWLAAALVALALLMVRTRVGLRLPAGALVAWCGVLVALTFVMGPLSHALQANAPLSLAQRFEHGGGRLLIWANLLEGLKQSPWVGYGWSQVSRAALEGSATHYVGERMLRQAHSVPLDILLWAGIPLGMLIIAAIAWWWWRQVTRCDTAERAVVIAAVGVVSIHSLVEFPLESFYFMVPFGLLVGVLEGWDDPANAGTRAARPALVGVVATLAALGMAVIVEYLTVEEASRSGRMLAAGIIPSAHIPQARLLDEPIEYIRFWRTQARPGMTAEELDWMRRVSGRNPAPPSLLRYATAMGMNGQPKAAQRTLVQLCNMHNPRSCDEGRKSWAQLQQNFPVLAPIPYPATPRPG